MNKENVEAKIKGIVVSKLSNSAVIDSLDFDTPLLSLGIDSILAISILVEIEEMFDIEINDDDLNMDSIRSIRNFADLIRSYLE